MNAHSYRPPAPRLRPRLWEARPRQQVGAVGVHARRELRVEDEVARRAKLREVRQRAPTHDEVAPVGCLGVALRRCAQTLGLVVGFDQRGSVVLLIQLHRDGAAASPAKARRS
jgi:hypothetical protein